MRRHTFIPVACALCAVVASLSFWQAGLWRATLRSELQFYSTSDIGVISIPKLSGGGTSHFSISAKVGRILESHDRTEVLTYLSELRQSATPFGRALLREWAEVVTSGVRGVPATARFTQGTESRQLATYTYSIPYSVSRTHPPGLTTRSSEQAGR